MNQEYSSIKLIKEASNILSRVNSKMLPPGYFDRTLEWLKEANTYLELDRIRQETSVLNHYTQEVEEEE